MCRPKEVSDGVVFVFGDGREAKSTAEVNEGPTPSVAAAVMEVVERTAPSPPVAAAAVVPPPAPRAATQLPVQQQGVDAHPLLAIVAFAELLVDAVNPTAGQTRKIKRSSMRKADASAQSVKSTYVAPAGVLGRASLPGAILGLVATAVTGVVRQLAAKASK